MIISVLNVFIIEYIF